MLKRSYRDAGVEAHMASLLRHPTSADQPHSFPNVVTEPSDVRGWQVKSWIWNGDLNGRSLEALQRREGMGESRGKLTTWRFCTLEVVTHHSINQCLWLSYGSENQLFFESLVFFSISVHTVCISLQSMLAFWQICSWMLVKERQRFWRKLAVQRNTKHSCTATNIWIIISATLQ